MIGRAREKGFLTVMVHTITFFVFFFDSVSNEEYCSAGFWDAKNGSFRWEDTTMSDRPLVTSLNV